MHHAHALVLRRSLLGTLLVLIAGAFSPALSAEAGMDAVAAFINLVSNQLLSVARNTCPEQKLAGLRELLRETFDVPAMGRFVLGRFARVLRPAEQQEFQALFQALFEDVVLTHLDRENYAAPGVVVTVIRSRQDPYGAVVTSRIVRGGSAARPLTVAWTLIRRDNGLYRIVDVTIDGVSMAVAGRTELEGIVERNDDPHALLPVLRQQIAIIEQRRRGSEGAACAFGEGCCAPPAG